MEISIRNRWSRLKGMCRSYQIVREHSGLGPDGLIDPKAWEALVLVNKDVEQWDRGRKPFLLYERIRMLQGECMVTAEDVRYSSGSSNGHSSEVEMRKELEEMHGGRFRLFSGSSTTNGPGTTVLNEESPLQPVCLDLGSEACKAQPSPPSKGGSSASSRVSQRTKEKGKTLQDKRAYFDELQSQVGLG
jgi:hypothetical protein